MAVKWLQSAVYPPAAPQLRTGRTREENDADYARLRVATAWARSEEEKEYGQAPARQRRPLQGYRTRR